jgi:hypothetical protein
MHSLQIKIALIDFSKLEQIWKREKYVEIISSCARKELGPLRLEILKIKKHRHSTMPCVSEV